MAGAAAILALALAPGAAPPQEGGFREEARRAVAALDAEGRGVSVYDGGAPHGAAPVSPRVPLPRQRRLQPERGGAGRLPGGRGKVTGGAPAPFFL